MSVRGHCSTDLYPWEQILPNFFLNSVSIVCQRSSGIPMGRAKVLVIIYAPCIHISYTHTNRTRSGYKFLYHFFVQM